jgi:hypothetical protein
MNIEEIHKDVHKALIEDEKYQQFMSTIQNEQEKKLLSDFMQRFMTYFQEKVFDPLAEKMENDKDFKDAVCKNLEDIIPNKDKEI